ncbi:MAG: class I SAM-dependent methyltransferase [Planctomycetota bacterium]
MSTWFDNDALWDDFAPVVFRPKVREKAAEEVDRIIELAGPPSGAAILDLPCGVGRHALELGRRGYRVTAVDRTRRYLDEGRGCSAEEKLDIEWVEADMREFRRPEAFDCALNIYTSFGYFEDPGDDRRVIENYAASLKPGGRLVMDMFSKEILARDFQKRDWVELEDGTILLEERVIEDAWRRLRCRWIALRGAERHEHELVLRHYSAAELIDLLERCGFVEARAFGSLEGEPYDQDAKRLVVVAKRG